MSAVRLLAEQNSPDRRLSDSPTKGFSSVLQEPWAWRAEWRQPSGTLCLYLIDAAFATDAIFMQRGRHDSSCLAQCQTRLRRRVEGRFTGLHFADCELIQQVANCFFCGAAIQQSGQFALCCFYTNFPENYRAGIVNSAW